MFLKFSDKGELFTFGRGDRGQLGHGTNENIFFPKIVEYFIGKRVSLISAGFAHTVVVTGYLHSDINDLLFHHI